MPNNLRENRVDACVAWGVDGACFCLQGHQQPQPQVDSREPLYAQVDKRNKKRQEGMQHSPGGRMMLDGGGPDGGADSWV